MRSNIVPPALNHYETVYRPGEAPLVKQFFALLGLEIRQLGPDANPFLIGYKDTETATRGGEFVAASQALPEQWALDQVLSQALQQGSLGDLFTQFQSIRSRTPYFATHLGMQFPSVVDWESAVSRLEDPGRFAPELRTRVILHQAFRPGDPGSLSDITWQAFLSTDLLACGSLAWPQMIELQYFDYSAYAAQTAG